MWWRSWIARRKTLATLRVPAGDVAGDEESECSPYLLTEDGEPIATEGTEFLRPEP